MARRRYITTETSVDKRLNMVAKRSDFAALFFLMLIPHVGDDCFITGDPEELLGVVFPLRRDKEEADIKEAVALLHNVGLLKWCSQQSLIMLSPKAFYRYQTYIKPERRTAQEVYDNFCCEDEISEEQRITPQIAASVSPSIPLASHKHSVKVSASAPTDAGASGTAAAPTIKHVLDDPPPDLREIRSCLYRDKYTNEEVELAIKHLERKQHDALKRGGPGLLKLLKVVIENDIRPYPRGSPNGTFAVVDKQAAKTEQWVKDYEARTGKKVN